VKSFKQIIIITLIGFMSFSCSAVEKKGEEKQDINKLLDVNKIKPKGQFYEDQVPDTLDLAKRAELAVNMLTNNVIAENYYSATGLNRDLNEKFSYELKGGVWDITPKNARALPLLRTMCGSEQNLDVEIGIMNALLSQVDEDGLMYFPPGTRTAPPETSWPTFSGITAMAIMNWSQRDGNPKWNEYTKLLAKGLKSSAIQVEDRAYYPPESGMGKDGKWRFTPRTGGKINFPYEPPQEPNRDYQGLEACVKFNQGAGVWALAENYRLTGDKESLEMAHKIARFCLKPELWENTTKYGFAGNEHGVWGGHCHGNMAPFLGLLKLAVEDNNPKMQQTLREAYAHTVRNSIIRMGWVPAWSMPHEYTEKGIQSVNWLSETCAIADTVILAVKLTDAGLGDYWDDVDSIVRNHLIEQQFTDINNALSYYDVKKDDKKRIDYLMKFIGGFGMYELTAKEPVVHTCCSANGAISLYYAWHGITRFDKGVAKVNLLLNRSSNWMDIDSFLPYEGKVVLKNKKAHTAMVRIPSWVDINKVKCTKRKFWSVQSEYHFSNAKRPSYIEEDIFPIKTGRYLMFSDLKPKDQIVLEFPVVESTDKYNVHGKTYTVKFRGSTVIDVQPRNNAPGKYPMYKREHYKKTQAPMIKIKRFAADKIISLN